MTTKVKISDITMKDRARCDYGDLEALQESMKKFGQLQPIIITERNELIAGGRRYSAALLMDWEEIEVKYFHDLSILERKEIELEENLIRKNLEWQEEVSLRDTINKLKKEIAEGKGEEWTNEDTADAIGIKRRQLQDDLELAKDVEKFPELENCKTKNEARTKARRLKNAETRKIKNIIFGDAKSSKEEMIGIHKGESEEILKEFPDNSVDLIIADPPFAIKFDTKERNQQYVETYGDLFTDEIREVMSIVEPVMEECARILKPGGHIYLFFGIQHYNSFYCALETTWYLTVQSTPLFWIKKSGENKRPYHRYTVNYEACFFAWKSKEEENPKIKYEQREFNNPHVATFENHPLSTSKKEHPAQKPLSLYKEIIKISSHEGDIVLDPFAGSGMCGVAAKQLNREIVLVERLPIWYDLSVYNVNNYKEYTE